MTRGRGALRVCVLLLAAAAVSAEQSGRALLQQTVSPPAANCFDRPTPEGFTCEQQKGWGKVSMQCTGSGEPLQLSRSPKHSVLAACSAPRGGWWMAASADAPATSAACRHLPSPRDPPRGPSRTTCRAWRPRRRSPRCVVAASSIPPFLGCMRLLPAFHPHPTPLRSAAAQQLGLLHPAVCNGALPLRHARLVLGQRGGHVPPLPLRRLPGGPA